jgi:hypothetical protein
VHVKFFRVMTSKDWARGIDGCLWSAEMILHASDGSEATLLVGHAPVVNTATDQSKKSLLTIHEPLVMRHMALMHSVIDSEWRRLMSKRVHMHLSARMTQSELTAGHKTGELVTVLVFASRVFFIFNSTARFLIFRKADEARTRWERVGRLTMTIEESELDGNKRTAGIIATMPFKKFGKHICLI